MDCVDVAALEEQLSRPTTGAVETLRSLPGDVLILGAGGKMGPTLARMVRRACDALGQADRRVVAVSRFSSATAREELPRQRVETIACDLLDRAAVARLPDAPLVFYLAGQKFGTQDRPWVTWEMNTLAPAIIAERYASSRIVAFSTGCVYPPMPLDGRGAREDDPLEPPGEYANSCVGRERVLEALAHRHGTRLLLFRLCYAIDLRYGVLCDLAQRVWRGEPVDVTMGAVHLIWQGDACARAIQCLAHTSNPPTALNVTGLERLSIRELARRLGERLGKLPRFVGTEGECGWIWDASRSYEWFGPPTVSLEELLDATAAWTRNGGATLGKPTHFEVTDGRF